MARLHLLGTGAALAGAGRTTTMLAFEADSSVIVVDCGGDVIERLVTAGVELDHIDALILTHEHPDHVSGFPLFMEKIWLAERRRPIDVLGPRPAIDAARRVFEVFDTSGWKGLPEIRWHEVELTPNTSVWSKDPWVITASPGKHSVPVIGLRVEERENGGIVTYSADTERSDEIALLADTADILVHEATGGFSGHTSMQDAAHIAARANVGKLLLVHLPPEIPTEDLVEARRSFAEIELGEDGASYPF